MDRIWIIRKRSWNYVGSFGCGRMLFLGLQVRVRDWRLANVKTSSDVHEENGVQAWRKNRTRAAMYANNNDEKCGTNLVKEKEFFQNEMHLDRSSRLEVRVNHSSLIFGFWIFKIGKIFPNDPSEIRKRWHRIERPIQKLCAASSRGKPSKPLLELSRHRRGSHLSRFLFVAQGSGNKKATFN